MQDNEFDLRMKISKYEEVLNEIASAGEQANPKHLSGVAQRVLTFYSNDGEPTTADELNSRYSTNADEFNVPIITGDKDTDALLEDERIAQDDELRTQQESLDRYRETQAEIAEYDKKLSEQAESTWRNTVLHPGYKSEYDEEE